MFVENQTNRAVAPIYRSNGQLPHDNLDNFLFTGVYWLTSNLLYHSLGLVLMAVE